MESNNVNVHITIFLLLSPCLCAVTHRQARRWKPIRPKIRRTSPPENPSEMKVSATIDKLSSCCLFYHSQSVAILNIVSYRYFYRNDFAVFWGLYRILHFHCLKNKNNIPCLHSISHPGFDMSN